MPLSAGTLTSPTPSPTSSRPGAWNAPRQRDEAALGDRLRAPLDPLAALEDRPHARMRLQLLQQVVHRERRVAVVEADHHADAHVVVAHRVDERAAELAVASAGAQRPPERVDHLPQRLRHLPDLLHAERPRLRARARETEMPERRP